MMSIKESVYEFIGMLEERLIDVSFIRSKFPEAMFNADGWEFLSGLISCCEELAKQKNVPQELLNKAERYDNLLESLKDNNHTECLDYYMSCVDVNSIITKLDDYKELCRVCHNNDIDPDCLDSELESLKDAKREIITDLEYIVNNYS